MPLHTVTQEWLEGLPEEVRNHLHLQPGDKVEFVLEPEGRVEVRPLSGSIMSLFGILHRPGEPPATIEEMDEAVGRYLAEDDERIQKGCREGH